jgi:hypothetical protein
MGDTEPAEAVEALLLDSEFFENRVQRATKEVRLKKWRSAEVRIGGCASKMFSLPLLTLHEGKGDTEVFSRWPLANRNHRT